MIFECYNSHIFHISLIRHNTENIIVDFIKMMAHMGEIMAPVETYDLGMYPTKLKDGKA